MALHKQPVSINFAQGLDLKSDPYQIPIGRFQALSNSIFTKAGRLTKRNGFQNITSLPNTTQTTLTTLNDNLIATGSNLYAFSEDTNAWLNQGIVQPVQLNTLPLVRVSTSQTSPDIAVSANGLTCLVYQDNGKSYYQVSDSITGQQVVTRTLLPNSALNPRAFVLGPWFIVMFISNIAATPTLQFIAIPIMNPSAPNATMNISADLKSTTAGYDAFLVDTQLYVAWGRSTAAVGIAFISQGLAVSASSTLAGSSADLMSVTADIPNNVIWLSFWDAGSTNGFVAAYSTIFAVLVTSTPIIVTTAISEITSIAANGVLSIFYENINNYSYFVHGSDPIRSDFISKLTVTRPVGIGAGVVSSTTVMLRSVGLASKAFMGASGTTYMMVAYGDTAQVNPLDNSNQPTYFLVDSLGNIYMNLAYSNGGGYEASQVLPTISLINGTYYYPYLVNDFLATVNKTTNPGQPVNAIYTQTGVNLAKFSLNTIGQHSSEIAGALHLTGGQLWEYDGVKPVELGFHVWPENIAVTTSGAGGLITAQTYNYVFTYEWTDNAGNLHRSAPSIPVTIVTTGATSTNTIKVPTLRLTYKQPFLAPTNNLVKNPVRIVGYRWSTAQQVYYQFTSLTTPKLDDTTIDSVTFTDTQADSAILGNVILYTTGGVIENISAPASIASALFNNRLFIIDAEDQNLLWFSKQVIENTPVEMSDLLTIYVAPTTGAQGSTGPMQALGAMDDKLIIFKKDAIYYINGSGPDNTGANSSFSDPVFVTGTVGSSNPSSIVLIPNGLMFQSDKGIWILGRDLSTQYIGAPVEQYNSNIVLSATAIPGTNQVRFILDNHITLMYDYFFNQWATHTNINAVSGTLYQSAHTYLNNFGQIFQEVENTYIDGSKPVLLSLTTSWMNIAGLQGYERFYFANLLGTTYTPFKLNVQFAYDYNPSPTKAILVTPDNNFNNWGDEALWGSGPPWGGTGNVFSARCFPDKQKCESFQVIIEEVYDSSLGVVAGQGLSLSGLALVVGVKKGYRTQSARKSFG